MNFTDFITEMARRSEIAQGRLDARRDLRAAGRLLLASQHGLLDPLRLPARLIKPNGRSNLDHIDDAPARPYHSLITLPRYDDIPAAVARVASESNEARRLRGLGLVLEDKSCKSLHREIRGVMRALWVFHLWNGDDVRRLRPRYYHPDDVRMYWPHAWDMHRDGTRHADALAYLRTLTAEWTKRTNRPHAAEAFAESVQAILNDVEAA